MAELQFVSVTAITYTAAIANTLRLRLYAVSHQSAVGKNVEAEEMQGDSAIAVSDASD